MVLEPVCCPDCGSDNIIRYGLTAAGKPRYRCKNEHCARQTFIQDYTYQAYDPVVKEQISDMAINGSGIRDTARVLEISPTTVIKRLKKKFRDPSD
jgi:transposase-like protein